MTHSSIKTDKVDFVLLHCGMTLINKPLSLWSSLLGEKFQSQFTWFSYKPTGKEQKIPYNSPIQQGFLVAASGILPFISLLLEIHMFKVSFAHSFVITIIGTAFSSSLKKLVSFMHTCIQ